MRIRKKQPRWYLLFRMEDGRAVHRYEPLRKYELLSRLKNGWRVICGHKERLSYKTSYGRFCDGFRARTLRNKNPLFLPNYARDNHLKRVWVSIILETKKELKMLYYYPPFHLYQRQQYNYYPWTNPWTYPGSSHYVYGHPNSPCYRECLSSGAGSYFCCYICGIC